MSVPLIQQYRLGRYLLSQTLRAASRYPLVLMLEPLFRCNLACAGCGKVTHPQAVLDRTLSAAECLASVDECGAPVVSVAGGEPLLHPEMPRIIEGIAARKKFAYLCTNALLLQRRMGEYSPSPYLTFSIHLDGSRERHDASVRREGVFDTAVAAVREAVARGFRVTINCTLFEGEQASRVAEFFDWVTSLGVEGITVSPGYDYENAREKDVFLQRNAGKELFRQMLELSSGRNWKFNHSALFLDFLAGNRTYQCTPWGNPTRNVLGWQRPCYLLAEGYARTFQELMEETVWDRYGLGRNPKCANCMMHCGFEPTAVRDTFQHPVRALWVAVRGPRTRGPFAPEPVPSAADSDGEPIPAPDVAGPGAGPN